jgi:hypothetical protein
MLALLLSTVVRGQSSPDRAELFRQIDALGGAKHNSEAEKRETLGKLAELANAVRAQYRDSNPEAYAQLTARICGCMQALDLLDARRLYLAQDCAMRALEKATDISLDAQTRLVGHVQHITRSSNSLTFSIPPHNGRAPHESSS